MRSNIIKIFTSVSVLLMPLFSFSFYARAQSYLDLTLEKTVAIALEKNRDVVKSKEETFKADFQIIEAASAAFPQVNGQWTFDKNLKPQGNYRGDASRIQISILAYKPFGHSQIFWENCQAKRPGGTVRTVNSYSQSEGTSIRARDRFQPLYENARPLPKKSVGKFCVLCARKPGLFF